MSRKANRRKKALSAGVLSTERAKGAGSSVLGTQDSVLSAERAPLSLSRALLCAALIAAAAFTAYANSFRGVFLLDDIGDIVENESVHRLWPLWECMLAPLSYGRPVVMLTFAANYALGGVNPWGYHAFNLAVHILSALLLFGITRWTLVSGRLRKRFGGVATPLALITALLWAVHPLQTQAVTYVIQRFESLMAFFFLLTLYFFVRGCHSQRPRGWHAAAVAACALGMGCKQVMAAAPLVVLAYDWVFAAGSWRAVANRWKLHAALAATWVLLAVLLTASPKLPPAGSELAGHTALQYVCSQPGIILHYLWLAVWPSQLCLDYLWPVAETPAEILLPGLVVLAFLGATVWALWRRPAWGFCGAWFFLILAPTSSFMPIADLAFEHRMYLPLAAVLAAGTCAVFCVGRTLFERRGGRFAAAGLAGLLLAVLIWRTIGRNEDYTSDLRMWLRVAEQRPRNPRAFNNLGNALKRAGQLEEAAARYRQALEIKSDFVEAHYNLGNALDKLGRPEEAAASYQRALQFAPDDAWTHNNLAVVLEKLHRFDDAASHAREAARLDPDSSAPQVNLGKALAGAGHREEAIAAYRKALQISPALTDVRYQLGLLLDEAGQQAEARACFQQVLLAKPGFASELNEHGIALAKVSRWEEAIAQFRKAVRIKPDYANAYNNLGNVLDGAGRLEEAAAAYEEALRLQPDYANAHYNLADTLNKLGRSEAAAAHAREGERLKTAAAATK